MKVAASEPANAPSGILVRKNQTALVDAINKALNEIKADGTFKTISLRYFGQDVSQ
ncbi:hypothetical protein SODG_007402 [Sodalis praecaptivus]